VYAEAARERVHTHYGFNWGPLIYAGGGLHGPETPAPSGNGNYMPGLTLAAIIAPAQVVVYGDSFDTYRPTLGFDWMLDSYNAGYKNLSNRHGGRFNFSFADGHAKLIQMKGGLIGTHRYLVPKNAIDEDHWCADPDAVINLTPKYGIGPTRCGDIARLIETSWTAWPE